VPLLGLGLFQRDDLRLGQTRPPWALLASDHAAHAGGRDREPALPQLVDNADLTEGRLFDRQRYDGTLDLLWHAVLQRRLLASDLLQRQFAALVVGLFEPVEAVAATNHCVTRRGSASWSMGSKKSLGIFENIAN
jgi:hypothetical protein